MRWHLHINKSIDIYHGKQLLTQLTGVTEVKTGVKVGGGLEEQQLRGWTLEPHCHNSQI